MRRRNIITEGRKCGPGYRDSRRVMYRWLNYQSVEVIGAKVWVSRSRCGFRPADRGGGTVLVQLKIYEGDPRPRSLCSLCADINISRFISEASRRRGQRHAFFSYLFVSTPPPSSVSSSRSPFPGLPPSPPRIVWPIVLAQGGQRHGNQREGTSSRGGRIENFWLSACRSRPPFCGAILRDSVRSQ